MKRIPGQPMMPGAPGWEFSLNRQSWLIRNLSLFYATITSVKETDDGVEIEFKVLRDDYNLMDTYARFDCGTSIAIANKE